jgi:D-glycero-D-manno-heptose 1,7-bisphosphate phosphatase
MRGGGSLNSILRSSAPPRNNCFFLLFIDLRSCNACPSMNKCIFLDRDGVLNVDDPGYTFLTTKFRIIPGVIEALYRLKEAGYYLIVATNQSGISKGLYTRNQMELCHIYLQEACDHVIDHFYFCPYHREITNSLARKPGSLMFEKGLARFNGDPSQSWMIGDRGRDLIPARALGIRTIQLGDEVEPENRGDFCVDDLSQAAQIVLTC